MVFLADNRIVDGDRSDTSTRAVYSLFGSKAGLLAALGVPGYSNLGDRLGALAPTDEIAFAFHSLCQGMAGGELSRDPRNPLGNDMWMETSRRLTFDIPEPRSTIRYIPASSNVAVSAVDVNQRQSGVCRDLSHLGIALCRRLSIPARLVAGYLEGLEPMDMHAWFEAYVGGCRYAFDATRNELNPGYVAIGYGRDPADVAVYNQLGRVVYPLSQKINVHRA